MQAIFSTILSMSLAASVVAFVVMGVRLCLKRAPKIFSYALWGLVLFRMLCPISFINDISVVPDFNEIAEPLTQIEISGEIPFLPETQHVPDSEQVETDPASQPETATDTPPVVSPGEQAETGGQPPIKIDEPSGNEKPAILFGRILAFAWAGGFIFMLGFAAASYLWMHNRVADATKMEGNIFESDKIDSPFVFGFIQPKIYVPTYLREDSFTHIVAHERAHIRRGDHIVKMLFWTALAVHWFNPLLWFGFFLMNRDMELSCDEIVLKHAEKDIRATYSTNLLALAERRSGLVPMALSFGETNVKARVKNTLRYRKPSFWITIIATILVVGISLTLVGNATVLGSGMAGDGMDLETIVPDVFTRGNETDAWENNALSLFGKILKIDGWVYYVPDYNDTVYRMKEDGSNKTALFTANLGQSRGGGVTNLTQCGAYLLFTHAAYIYKTNLNTLKTEVLVQADNPSTCFDFAIQENKVYFVGTNIDADYLDGVYVIDIDGETPERITAGVRGDFWNIQIYDNKIYVSAQNEGLKRLSLDGSDVESIPNVLEHSTGNFIISDGRVLWLTHDNALLSADLDGNDVRYISENCTGVIAKEEKILYSEIKLNSSGIFMCDSDGQNHKTLYNGVATIIGCYDNIIFIDTDSDVFELQEINIKGSKAPANTNAAGSETVQVTTEQEFIEAAADKNVKHIEVVEDMTLDGSGVYLYSSENKQTLIVDQEATLTVETSNFMLQGCNVVNNGKIIVSGRILTYDAVTFSGSGEITCASYGTIECYIQSAPAMHTLKALLSKDSVYTNVSIRDWSSTEFVLTEDLEIPRGKVFEVYKYDEPYTLVVPIGITLINNGTLLLSNMPELNGRYQGSGSAYVQESAVELH